MGASGLRDVLSKGLGVSALGSNDLGSTQPPKPGKITRPIPHNS